MPIDMPPDYNAFKEEVLTDQARDVQCPYEVWWSANSRYPALPASTRLAIAESVVTDLIHEGHIVLVRGRWAGYEFEHQALPDEHTLLLDHTTWDPEPDALGVWMCDRCPDCPGRRAPIDCQPPETPQHHEPRARETRDRPRLKPLRALLGRQP